MTLSVITITTHIVWQPIASDGQCRVRCEVHNGSLNVLYIFAFVASGTPTPTQILRYARDASVCSQKPPLRISTQLPCSTF
jgi:hypothetical protein